MCACTEHEILRARGSAVGSLEVPSRGRCLVTEVWGSAEDGGTFHQGLWRSLPRGNLTLRDEEGLNQRGGKVRSRGQVRPGLKD